MIPTATPVGSHCGKSAVITRADKMQPDALPLLDKAAFSAASRANPPTMFDRASENGHGNADSFVSEVSKTPLRLDP